MSSSRSDRNANDAQKRARSLQAVQEQLETAAGARKCHGCGCFHKTVEVLSRTEMGTTELARVLAEARKVFVPKEYDCLGCPVCYPAVAANVFSEAFPVLGEELDLCPTDSPGERRGWPPLPGDYHVVRFRAPVAVCTLNSDDLAARIARAAPEGLAIAGTLHTENLGIERLIRNLLANPHIRFLVLCGQDTQQAVGHLPGQSLASLVSEGIDERGRIRGARGRRPVLKNITREQVELFVRKVELVPIIGEERDAQVLSRIADCEARDLGPFEGALVDAGVETVPAEEPSRLVPDPSGFFVVYPDASRRKLELEHYTTAGVLDCVLEGGTPAALYATAIERKLISRLDHAAYLGRELARAEQSMKTGEPYVQDRAAGEIAPAPSCGCGTACAPRGLS